MSCLENPDQCWSGFLTCSKQEWYTEIVTSYFVLRMLKLQIKATRMDLTSELQSRIEEKVTKLEKYIPDDQEVLCAVEVEHTTENSPSGYEYRAEIRLSGGGMDFYADNAEPTIESAIDQVVDEMSGQLRRDRDRQKTDVRRAGAEVKEWMRNQ